MHMAVASAALQTKQTVIGRTPGSGSFIVCDLPRYLKYLLTTSINSLAAPCCASVAFRLTSKT